MSNEQISKFLESKFLDITPVNINFKIRGTFRGLFIQAPDYHDLKTKNFWRIVSEGNIEKFNRSRDINFSRIYSGFEITQLSAVNS